MPKKQGNSVPVPQPDTPSRTTVLIVYGSLIVLLTVVVCMISVYLVGMEARAVPPPRDSGTGHSLSAMN